MDSMITLLDYYKKIIIHRDQYVQLRNIKSQLHGISCEIPPGSVMEPHLFNIVINDLNAASEN